jgi:tetratricopeptide (TPR) repeat protein
MTTLHSRSIAKLSIPAIAAIAIFTAGAALAAGGGGGGGGGGAGGSGSGGNAGVPVTCNDGWVYDKATGVCVRQQSSVVPDDALTGYAYAVAQEGRYQEALNVLALLQNPNTPEALNYKGYATRKLGRLDEGIGYYLQSVKLDADYTLVREYLGEAYIQLGRIDLARDQLGEIEKRCGTDCSPYLQLDAAIDAAL